MNRSIAIAGTILAAACAPTTGASHSATTTGGSVLPLPPATVGMLSSRTAIPWIALPTAINPHLLFPSQLPQPSFTPTGDADQDAANASAAASAFFAQYGAIWEMTAPASELIQSQSFETPDDLVLVFDQQTQGLPVFDSSLTISFDLTGRIETISANYVPGLDTLTTIPAVSAAEALQTAQSAYAAARGVAPETSGTPELGIEVSPDDDGAAPLLAYHVTLDSVLYLVDAQAGTILDTRSLIETLTGSGGSYRQQNGLAGGTTESFPVLPLGTAVPAPPVNFVTQAATPLATAAPLPIPNGDYLMGQIAGVAASYSTQGWNLPPLQFWDTTVTPAQPIFSANLNTWDTQSTQPGSSVDAANHVMVATQFFQKAHGWQSFDNKGDPVVSLTRIPQQVLNNGYNCNAFWVGGTQNFMAFFNCVGQAGELPAGVAQDTVGHEYGHAITSYTSRLKGCPNACPGQADACDSPCQYGTMNEAMSDVLGSMVEHSVVNNVTKNFEQGEDDFTTGQTWRNFIHPAQSFVIQGVHPQTGHMSQYCSTYNGAGGICDPHINATIPTNAYYLMNHGGTNDVSNVTVDGGLGWADAEKIWWQTEAACMKSTAKFYDVATCNLNKAQTLANNRGVSVQSLTQPVACAWWAVGVNVVDGGVVAPDAGNLPTYVGDPWDVCCGDQSDGGCDGGCVANQKTCAMDGGACCSATDSCSPSTVRGGDGGLVCCVPDGNPDPTDGGTGAQCCSQQDDGNGNCGAPCVKNQAACGATSVCCNGTDACITGDAGVTDGGSGTCCVADGNPDPDGTGGQCCAGTNDGNGNCGAPSGCVATGERCSGGASCCDQVAACQSDGVNSVCCFAKGVTPDTGDDTECCDGLGLGANGECL